MRDIVQQEVSHFLAGELPRDEGYYQRKNQEVAQLVEALKEFTGRGISWQPPEDMLNFHCLQLPVDLMLNLPLYEITIGDLQNLVDEGQPTSFLQLLLSNFSRFACTYWTRFFPPDFQENTSTEATFQDSAEELLFQQVQQKLEEHGWLWLPPAEADEIVLGAPPPWPNKEGSALVRHILFPGCTLLTD